MYECVTTARDTTTCVGVSPVSGCRWVRGGPALAEHKEWMVSTGGDTHSSPSLLLAEGQHHAVRLARAVCNINLLHF